MDANELQELVADRRKALGVGEGTVGASPLGVLVEKVAARIPDSAAPPIDPLAEARRETARRQANWKAFCRQCGILHSACNLDGYRLEHPGQREVVTALRLYCEQMPSEVAAGSGIVLFGPCGTGKDHLLSAVARAAVLDHGIHVEWAYCLDLYGELRDRIGNEQDERAWVHRLVKPPVLYLSDPVPPKGPMSDYQATMLVRVLDGRNRAKRPVWTSINVRSIREADELMGPAVVDRLRPGSIAAYCDWPSYRRTRMVWSGVSKPPRIAQRPMGE